VLFPALFFLLLGCFSAWLIIFLLLASGFGQKGDAAPQHHHTHTGVIPRIGGVGLVSALFLTFALCFFFYDIDAGKRSLFYVACGGSILAFLLGFIDDFRPLGAKLKLIAQIGIGVGAFCGGLAIDRFTSPFTLETVDLGLFALPVTVIWFVAIMNLINLIDGLDGLAGGVGLMLMLLLAYFGLNFGFGLNVIIALGMIGGIIGFLFHNFPPAKVYMGDSGAYLIGFVIAALSLINSEKGTILAALVAPVLALALPIADVSFAMIRRGLKGLPLFRPDRNHIHHRLMRSGLSNRNTVLVLYLISLFALIGGLLTFSSQGRFLPIFFGFAFVLVLLALKGRRITASSVYSTVSESLQTRQDARNAIYLKNWIVVEAERADSGQNIWSDFRFVLKKMGFCRAELRIGEEERSFYVPNSLHEDLDSLWRETHSLRGETPVELTVYAEKDAFSKKQFNLIGDIAAEAFSSMASRWKEINGDSLSFSSIAAEPTTYRGTKARNLYRPTY